MFVKVGFSQNFSYPQIKTVSHSISDFVPMGWTVIDSAFGDLNHDKLDDLALVIQLTDSVSLVEDEDGYADTVITQPRILILAFYNKIEGKYNLVLQNNSFILCHDNPGMEEPFQSISIKKGVLNIDFFIFMNIGGWGMSNNTYRFRYQQNKFYLVGADYNYTNRASGEVKNRSYNFLTRKVILGTGNISSNKEKISKKDFKVKELKTFKTFIKPFTFEVEKDVII